MGIISPNISPSVQGVDLRGDKPQNPRATKIPAYMPSCWQWADW